jgi:hypothetical protein
MRILHVEDWLNALDTIHCISPFHLSPGEKAVIVAASTTTSGLVVPWFLAEPTLF